jgi:hypothetical protein
MKLRSLIKLIAVILVASSLVAVLLGFLVFQRRSLSSDDMENYSEALIAAYNNDIDFYFLENRGLFPFYSNLSYTANATVSNAHGAAILFEPSNEWQYRFQTVDQRVEDAIFGGNWSTWPAFIIPSGTIHSVIRGVGAGGIIETNGHPFVEVQGNGSTILLNITVNSIYYHCAIIKGTNETAFWTTGQAKSDAQDIFDVDLGTALANSEEIRRRYAEPELASLLRNVIEKMQNPKLQYSYLEREEDIKFIERLARDKYNVTEPSDFIRNMLGFLESKTAPQKTIFGFPVDDPSNWMYVGAWCAFPLFGLGVYAIGEYLSGKFLQKNKPLKELGKVIAGALIGGAAVDLIQGAPYDYEILSIQTLVLIVVLVAECILVFKGKDFLASLKRRFGAPRAAEPREPVSHEA